MRLLIAVSLLLVPFAGCIGGVGIIDSELFDYVTIERGDPTPVAMATCQDLHTALNLRAEQRALVSLHQDYQYRFEERNFFGGGEVAMEEAVEDGGSDTSAGAPASAPQAEGSGGSKFEYSTSDAEVTGTNNQEQGVDEADILKTDGEWTYAIDGQLLQILHSSTVGNLTSFATVKLGDGTGYGTQLLLVDGGNDTPSDDRLVVILNGVQDPDQETPDEGRGEPGSDEPDEARSSISYYPFYGGQFSRILVYELGDRSDPQVVADHYIEGSQVGARLVNGIAYVVIHYNEPYLELRTWAGPDDETLKEAGMTWEEFYNAPEEQQKEILLRSVQKAIADNKEVLSKTTLTDYLPTMYQQDVDSLVKAEYSEATCRTILSTLDDIGRSVSTIFSIDVADQALPFDTTQILGGYPLVYGAQAALVLASSSQEGWWFWAQPTLDEATNLHWFDLDGLEVSHRASGRVDGTVQDQFGIDVHNDQLRIVTTTGNWGRWWQEDPDPMQNHLFVFDEVGGLLVPTGSVTGFAEDERVWSARFTNDRAYVVTFEQIDPLWIIDLTDSSNPTILGELEIPGVSTYIHPLPGEDALLTIGLGPRVNGDEESGLDWSRIQVSLFDISDPTNPTRADVYDVTLPEAGEENGYSWGYSAALHEHKAFTYWDAIGMLAIPVSWHHYEETCEREGSRTTCTTVNEFNTGLNLLKVDRVNMTLSKYGSVNQTHLMTDEGNDNGWYWGTEVQRSYFLGFPNEYPEKPVSVYAYSALGISAHDLETLKNQDAVGFEGQFQYYGYSEEDTASSEEQTVLDDLPSATA
jgi:uncharacterized secreted protein with C-terminal beta-propeller domain